MYRKSIFFVTKKQLFLWAVLWLVFCFIYGVSAKEKVMVLGLAGAQAVNIRSNVAKVLSKHPKLQAMTLDDHAKASAKKKSKKQNVTAVHEQLHQAKKHYYALEYDDASQKLLKAIESYTHDHLYTQETVSGLMATYFYLALTQLELNQKTKAAQSMQAYIYIKFGVDDGRKTKKELSKKKYSPKVQTLYNNTLKTMQHLPKAKINFISYKPVDKIWINGQSYPVQDLDKINLYQGQYYIYSADNKGLPLYSAQVQLKKGSNILSLKEPVKTPIKKPDPTGMKFRFEWSNDGKKLHLNPEIKKVLSTLAMRYNTNKFVLLSFRQQKIYVSFFEQTTQKQTIAFEVKQINSILDYYQRTFKAEI
ncbi:hypothetical protein MRY82_09595 [bacterium]|nr:hypothetical protein [bacterium]